MSTTQVELGAGATMEVDVGAICLYRVLGDHLSLPAELQWSPMPKEQLQEVDLPRSL